MSLDPVFCIVVRAGISWRMDLALHHHDCSCFKNLNLFSHEEVTGNPNVGFDDEDLEGDFDPAKYDEAMQVYYPVPQGLSLFAKWCSEFCCSLLLPRNP